MQNKVMRKLKELEIDIEENSNFITKLTNLIDKIDFRIKRLEINAKIHD